MALLHSIYAIRWLLFVTHFLWLAICYLLSESFYLKHAITNKKNLVPFTNCCTSRNFFRRLPQWKISHMFANTTYISTLEEVISRNMPTKKQLIYHSLQFNWIIYCIHPHHYHPTTQTPEYHLGVPDKYLFTTKKYQQKQADMKKTVRQSSSTSRKILTKYFFTEIYYLMQDSFKI